MQRLRAVTRIETEGFRWFALRISAFSEFRAADALADAGLVGYCPLGARFLLWHHGRRARKGTVQQFPVFSRYIFCGLLAGQTIGRDLRMGIEAVLGDSAGPLAVPPAAIRHVNDLELAGEWDGTRSWKEKSKFAVGENVMVIDGPFRSFPARVDALESESRIRILIEIFGRPTPISVATCQVEPT